MRTTLTLDPDVAHLLDEQVHRQRKPFKQVVNDALRRGLSPGVAREPRKFRLKAHDGGLRSGLDPGHLNSLVDELETSEVVRKLGPRKRPRR